MSHRRWTVRLPRDSQLLDMLHEVSETSGLPLGFLLEEAVCEWYDNLPTEDEEESDVSDVVT